MRDVVRLAPALAADATENTMEVKIIGTTISLSARSHKVPNNPITLATAGGASQAWHNIPIARPIMHPNMVSGVMRRSMKLCACSVKGVVAVGCGVCDIACPCCRATKERRVGVHGPKLFLVSND